MNIYQSNLLHSPTFKFEIILHNSISNRISIALMFLLIIHSALSRNWFGKNITKRINNQPVNFSMRKHRLYWPRSLSSRTSNADRDCNFSDIILWNHLLNCFYLYYPLKINRHQLCWYIINNFIAFIYRYH